MLKGEEGWRAEKRWRGVRRGSVVWDGAHPR
jgi:hypothetical protein